MAALSCGLFVRPLLMINSMLSKTESSVAKHVRNNEKLKDKHKKEGKKWPGENTDDSNNRHPN